MANGAMSHEGRSTRELRQDLVRRLDPGGEMSVFMKAFTPLGDSKLAKGLLRLLGVDPHWMLARIRSGKLRASRRHTERTAQQGGDSWLITDEAVVKYLRDHPYDIDLR